MKQKKKKHIIHNFRVNNNNTNDLISILNVSSNWNMHNLYNLLILLKVKN